MTDTPTGYLSTDPVHAAIEDVLRRLNTGEAPRDIESRHVDVKRVPHAAFDRGDLRVRPLADFLWPPLACMANTPGGGALVLGVDDDGQHLGADLDAEPVRARVHELSDRRLTPDVHSVRLSDGTVVQVWRVAPALAPIAVNGRVRWRTHDRCVEIDPATWMASQAARHVDWSRLATATETAAAEPEAVRIARDLLASSGREDRRKLLEAPDDAALLRALPDATAGEGDVLTNAGRLLFTTIPNAVHYLHRPAAGHAPEHDARPDGPLLVQMARVFDLIQLRATFDEVALGPGVRRLARVPHRSAREAVLNGLVHRDWTVNLPTVVEHVRDVLRVTSPGGLPLDVRPERLLTGPSRPRYRGLADLTASLTLTDRAGNGVDLMWLEAAEAGRPIPTIIEQPDPAVVTTIVGGPPDTDWIRALEALRVGDLNELLALDAALERGFVTAPILAPIIQDTTDVASVVLQSLDGRGLHPVPSQPSGSTSAFIPDHALVDAVPGRRLPMRDTSVRTRVVLDYLDATGRISSTEAHDVTGLSPSTTSRLLRQLQDAGEVEASNVGGRGHANHYVRPTMTS